MFSVIKWKGFYYCGYSVEQGSLWCIKEASCFWLEEDQIPQHLRILELVEQIPRNELQIKRVLHGT